MFQATALGETIEKQPHSKPSVCFSQVLLPTKWHLHRMIQIPKDKAGGPEARWHLGKLVSPC